MTLPTRRVQAALPTPRTSMPIGRPRRRILVRPEKFVGCVSSSNSVATPAESHSANPSHAPAEHSLRAVRHLKFFVKEKLCFCCHPERQSMFSLSNLRDDRLNRMPWRAPGGGGRRLWWRKNPKTEIRGSNSFILKAQAYPFGFQALGFFRISFFGIRTLPFATTYDRD